MNVDQSSTKSHVFAVCLSALLLMGLSCQVTATTRALVVAGLGGTLEYNQAFDEHTRQIVGALQTLTASPDDVIYLSGSEASRQSIITAFNDLANEVDQLSTSDEPIETFVLVMLGHGNVNRDGWNFNLPGPDLTGVDLVGALAPLNITHQVVVASTSASGALLKPLTQPGRTVITATKSGGESNAVRFSEYFAEAISTDTADVDRNELLSVEEVFIHASNLTARYYDEQNLLASEHPRFESGSESSVTLAKLGALRDAKNNPEVAALLKDRSLLEKTFYEVKARKTETSPSVYYEQLEAVLIDIALLQKQIDSLIGRGS